MTYFSRIRQKNPFSRSHEIRGTTLRILIPERSPTPYTGRAQQDVDRSGRSGPQLAHELGTATHERPQDEQNEDGVVELASDRNEVGDEVNG